ncbi:unnamed protein product [Mytilus edulis]|uniref:Uncharacterized protein n=1 Tax=Mytilus edulis TaxID=6550 RepID=A0A8S3SMB8_MYTED|nr:unnamed protein product [Mytilus edulis]
MHDKSNYRVAGFGAGFLKALSSRESSFCLMEKLYWLIVITRDFSLFITTGRWKSQFHAQQSGMDLFGITYLEKNLVAISTSRGIQIVNHQTGTIVGNVPTNGECRGIAYNKGALICWVRSIGIESIQLSNFSTKTLVQIKENTDRLGISVYRNRIYATDYSNDAVSCYTLEGKKLWQFKNESVLKFPRGIAVDNNSNVYVAAYKCVICLSSDGKKFEKKLSAKEGLYDPSALHFDHIKK